MPASRAASITRRTACTAGPVPGGDGQTAATGPAAVAVHDDGYVERKRSSWSSRFVRSEASSLLARQKSPEPSR